MFGNRTRLEPETVFENRTRCPCPKIEHGFLIYLQRMNEVKVKLSRPQLSVKTSRASLVLDMAGQGSGKTLNISIDVIEKVRSVPRAIGFIGANTHKQLSQSTLKNCFKYWKDIAGWTKWSKSNPNGVFLVNTKPPEHFRQYEILDDYRVNITRIERFKTLFNC